MNPGQDAQNANLEQSEIVAVEEFPRHLVMRLLRADGATFECKLSGLQGHKLSDDLLRAVAKMMPRPASGG
jgi:hypothetical protein